MCVDVVISVGIKFSVNKQGIEFSINSHSYYDILTMEQLLQSCREDVITLSSQ